MTLIIGGVVLVLTLMLIGAVWVIFALLRRLEAAMQTISAQADRTFTMAETTAKAGPRTLDKMLDSLADSTAKIHQTIESTVKSVLTPPPVVLSNDSFGVGGYAMPTMGEGQEAAPWDHTDKFIPDTRDHGPTVDLGYEHEHEPGFDPDNPFDLPHLRKQGV